MIFVGKAKDLLTAYNTRTTAGLRVKAKLDRRKYPTGIRITKAEMEALSLHQDEYRGEWNYALHPRIS
jgi:hypothetical protein